MKITVIVDVQNDFIDGALGTPEAQATMPNIIARKKLADENGDFVIFTQDTHENDYLSTPEGMKLPVPHCIKGTRGWKIPDELEDLYTVEKSTFGSENLLGRIRRLDSDYVISEVELFGFCTDICVLSNAIMIKNAFPKIEVSVVADCCAGVTPELHEAALAVMKSCQINIK